MKRFGLMLFLADVTTSEIGQEASVLERRLNRRLCKACTEDSFNLGRS